MIILENAHFYEFVHLLSRVFTFIFINRNITTEMHKCDIFEKVSLMESKTSQNRITGLLIVGLIAGIVALHGDLLLGWGTYDPALEGLARKLSIYSDMSETRIFWSALCGLIGITVEEIGCFAIFRLIEPNSKKTARLFLTGTLGYMIFAGGAVHVQWLATVFINRYMLKTDPENALSLTTKFGIYFLLPGIVIFLLFFILQSVAFIYAFIKGLTPYPKWCVIFCVPVGMMISVLIGKIGNYNIANAIRCAWISIGNLFMFSGLLIMENRKYKRMNI